jgi:hypothetical protein
MHTTISQQSQLHNGSQVISFDRQNGSSMIEQWLTLVHGKPRRIGNGVGDHLLEGFRTGPLGACANQRARSLLLANPSAAEGGGLSLSVAHYRLDSVHADVWSQLRVLNVTGNNPQATHYGIAAGSVGGVRQKYAPPAAAYSEFRHLACTKSGPKSQIARRSIPAFDGHRGVGVTCERHGAALDGTRRLPRPRGSAVRLRMRLCPVLLNMSKPSPASAPHRSPVHSRVEGALSLKPALKTGRRE